jgi:hypothetical protein
MGMTSHGQMALRRRVVCPRAEARSVVMGLQFTRALRPQQWFSPRPRQARLDCCIVPCEGLFAACH